jgi:hypothetical protein
MDVEGLENKSTEIYNSIVTAKQDLNSINLGIEVNREELERLNRQKLQVQTALVNMNTSLGYQQVLRTAEAAAGNILKQNQAVLGAALRAVFQALKEEPRNELQILIYGSLTYPMYEPRNGNMPRNYLQLRQAVILQAAEEIYNDLLAKVVGNTMSSTLAI